MNPFRFALPALAAAALCLASCSATESRINKNEELFASYSPDIQAMIRSNRISQGFDANQVYMAFGKASRTEFQDGQEIWYYTRVFTRTVTEEKSASEYLAELHQYEQAVAAGQAGVHKPETHHTFQLRRTGVTRLVRFEGGQVVSWDEPEEMWLDEWQQS